MSKTGLLDRKKTAFLIIDIQERLMPVIHDNETVFNNTNRLIKGAQILGVPVIITEQYPKGLGHTCQEIELPENPDIVEKVCFSCIGAEEVHEKLKNLNVSSVVLAGAEAHICVLKTALDALEAGYEVHVTADAVSSRTPENKKLALERVRQSGAFIGSTEMLLFQLMDAAGSDEFKQISKLIK